MSARMLRNGYRWLGAITALVGCLVVYSATADDERPDRPFTPDPGVPTFETFKNWPPDELLERFQALSWGPLAFRRAQLFGQPVFFVLTVDWSRAAQRLASETLADPEVNRALNQAYITVVVNANLRPDIRERYQTGGWPAMAILLPNGKPMLSQANDLGKAAPITTSTLDSETLLFLLREGTVYWNKWRSLLMQVGDDWAEQEGPGPPTPGPVTEFASEQVTRWLLGAADREEGGFGAAPKFLVPGLDEYAALREARSLPALRRHSRITLEKLVESPLFDQREGGMHRLAAAPSFGAIEYEKLLTTNASLVRELTLSIRSSDSKQLREALRMTATFLTKRLGRPGGGFYLAQSADPTSADGGDYWRSGGRGASPPIDRLVLAGPNATAGAAVLRAGALLGDDRLIEAGRLALDLVHAQAYAQGRGVRHVIEPAIASGVYLDTQSDVAMGFLDGYETTGDRRYLDAAADTVEFVRLNLKSEVEGLYRDHLPGTDAFGLLSNERQPMKPNVRLARAMLRLDLHGLGNGYRDEALVILGQFTGQLEAFGVHGVYGALGIEEAVSEPLLVQVSGDPGKKQTAALRRAAAALSWPWTVVTAGAADDEPAAILSRAGARRSVSDPKALNEVAQALLAEGGE